MKTIVAILTVLLLSACQKIPDADWERAPMEYQCTAEQMLAVESQTLFCKNQTSYYATYCYGTALMRNCTKAAK